MHTGHCPCHPEPLVGSDVSRVMCHVCDCLQVLGNYRDEDLEVVEGGMGDWHYMFSDCLELTVEVSEQCTMHGRLSAAH